MRGHIMKHARPALGALLIVVAAGLAGCSSEAWIEKKFEKTAEAKCEELLSACPEGAPFKCYCTHEISKPEDPSAPYEASITLLVALDKKYRKNGVWGKTDTYSYRYSGGIWEETGTAVSKPATLPGSEGR